MTALPQWLKQVINLDNTKLVSGLENDLKRSLTIAQSYRSDPDNFVDAYQYVQSHPAFWWRDDSDLDSSWHTNNYIEKIWAEHLRSAEDYQWALEAGRSVENNYTYHYHDLRLDSYGLPLEEAYVSLAEKLYQIFDDYGIERNNIDHLESPVIKEALERAEEWDEKYNDKNKD